MKTVRLPIDEKKTLKRASDVLIRGGVIAYPTETIYGLGARYDNENALARICSLKKRPEEKVMPLIIGSLEQLDLIALSINDAARRLMSGFWPGPLTLLLPAKDGLSPFVARDGKIAVRMPGESFALSLARQLDIPITATSANISGMPPALNADMVAGYFGEGLDLIADGGECRSTAPSTIIDATGPDLLVIREGAIAFSVINTFLSRAAHSRS